MSELDIINFDELESIFDYQDIPSMSLPLKRPYEPPSDEFGLVPGTLEFKEARKRRQNRESATRSRARKRTGIKDLQSTLEEVMTYNAELSTENESLKSENETLRVELEKLRTKGKAKTRSGLAMASTILAICCCTLIVSEEPVSAPLTGGQLPKFLGGPQPVSFGPLVYFPVFLFLAFLYLVFRRAKS